MRSRLTRTTALSMALLTGSAAAAAAQIGIADPAVPGTYAITNARIVPVSGATINRGTVVIRDGLIAAVGANASVPADARIIDGSGLSVYPGLIDGVSHLGIPTPRRQNGGGGGGGFLGQQQGDPVEAPNSLHPAGLQPELLAANIIEFEGNALEGARGAGLTAALTAPRDGIFAGQSALINLAGDNARDMLVESPIALHVGFRAVRGRGYPGSLLGVFASLRQMLLDAQRYGQLNAAYDRDPRGMRRPENDPSLEALQPVLARTMPVIMEANSEREIRRALDMAKEFGLRVYISGGEEAWKVADRLKAENVPVIATLNFPTPPANPPAGADPTPMRVLQSRVDIPRNPGRLVADGIKVAFMSGGVGMNELLNNVREAVKDGMPREQALRALTLTPAELYGVSNRLGSIEAGKIANLTVVRGDLFDDNSRVTQVFIDGRPMAVRAPSSSNANAASGTWTITATFPDGDRTITLNLRQEGTTVRGSIQGSLGSNDISNGTLSSEGELQFTVPVTLTQTSEEATFTGTLTGNAMRGTIAITGTPSGTFVGTRPNGAPQGARRGGQRPPAN